MADSDDDLQFESFDNYFSGLPAATIPIGSAPMLVFQSGTTKQVPATSVIRIVLSGNDKRFVSVTGSDSNDGLTLATAWATLTHAALELATYDFGGFQLTVNIGAGIFVGAGLRSIVGGGLVLWKGSGSATTILTNGPNDGVYNFGECFGSNVITSVIVAVDAVGFSDLTGAGGVLVGNFTSFQLGDPITFTLDLAYSSPGRAPSAVFFYNLANVSTNFGTFTVKQDGTVGSGAAITLESAFVTDNISWSFTGSANTYANTVVLAFGSSYTSFSASFTGSVNGPRYGIFNNSQACGSSFPGQLGLNFFPGSSAGFTDPTSTYDGYPFAITGAGDPNVHASGATLYSLGDDTAWSVWKDTNTGNFYIGVNTAGTIEKTLIGGISATITTAKLTPGGTNGSMTFVSGILTAQTPAT